MVRVRLVQKSVRRPYRSGASIPWGGWGVRGGGERRDIWFLALARVFFLEAEGTDTWAGRQPLPPHSRAGAVLSAHRVQACSGSLAKGLARVPVVPGP